MFLFLFIFYFNGKCYDINIIAMIDIPNEVMSDIIPSSHRPCAEIFKMASHQPIMQSIIDWPGQTDDWLWKSSQFPALEYGLIR